MRRFFSDYGGLIFLAAFFLAIFLFLGLTDGADHAKVLSINGDTAIVQWDILQGQVSAFVPISDVHVGDEVKIESQGGMYSQTLYISRKVE